MRKSVLAFLLLVLGCSDHLTASSGDPATADASADNVLAVGQADDALTATDDARQIAIDDADIVLPKDCGNGLCDGEETPVNCAIDCSWLWQRLAGPCNTPGANDVCALGYVCAARSVAGGDNVCVSDTNSWLPLPDVRPWTDFVDDGATVRDTVTGLQWAKGATQPLPWEDAIVACTANSAGGFSDWRTPTLTELLTLTDLQHFQMNSSLGRRIWPPDALSLWSGTPYIGPGDAGTQAWHFDAIVSAFLYGYTVKTRNVGCVRGGSLTGTGGGERFNVSADGLTVFDHATGLRWQRAAATTGLHWPEARDACTSRGADWRLPTHSEMATLMGWGDPTKIIDQAAFPDPAPGPFWTTSPVASAAPVGYAVVNFLQGKLFDGVTSSATHHRSPDDWCRFRCVH